LTQGAAVGVERRASYQQKKALLRDVFGGIHGTGKAVREPEHLPMVRFKESSKGGGLAAGSPREKCVFRISVHERLYTLFNGSAKKIRYRGRLFGGTGD
jgi:hypothetical protein